MEINPNAQVDNGRINGAFREKMQETRAKYDYIPVKLKTASGELSYLRAVGPRVKLEIELAYLQDEIMRGPRYIAPKMVQLALARIGGFKDAGSAQE